MHLHTGDALTVLRSLPSGSVQTCVTSPPYWGLRDYGMVGQVGGETTVDDYVAKLVAIGEEIRRVLRDDGTFWLNLGDTFITAKGASGGRDPKQPARRFGCRPNDVRVPGFKRKDLVGVPWRVAFALQSAGWYLRSDIVWEKPNPMPESVLDRPTRAHEFIFLLTKSERYFYEATAILEPAVGEAGGRVIGGKTQAVRENRVSPRMHLPRERRNARSVWTIYPKPYKGPHFAVFPPGLPERCIQAGTSEHGCCGECGAPWVREVGRARGPDRARRRQHRTGDSLGAAHGEDGRSGSRCRVEVKTLGWRPGCKCSVGVTPCVVLDPFAGSGTTGAVAKTLGRDFVGIDLNPAYLALARKRIAESRPEPPGVTP